MWYGVESGRDNELGGYRTGGREAGRSSFFTAAGSGFLFTFPHPVALAINDRDVGVMGEAVQQRGDRGRVGEDGVPVITIGRLGHAAS